MTLTRIFAGAIVASSITAAAPAQAKNLVSCAIVPRLMGQFLELHVAYREPDRRLRDRVIEQYVDRGLVCVDPACRSAGLQRVEEAVRR